MSPENVALELRRNVVKEFNRAPPTVGLIGLSGTGKSSTINALFGQNLRIIHTVRGTKEFERIRPDRKAEES